MTVQAHRIRRREFLEGSAALGIGATLGAQGCRSKNTLNVYNWSDYIAPEVLIDFEKRFGVKVNYDVYESNEQMLAKLQAGASGYDIVVPSNYMVPLMVKTGMLMALDKTELPNLKYVAKEFVKPVFDPEGNHGVPYLWGVTGFAYRKDKVANPGDSWAIFQAPEYRRRMTQMDDMREAIAAWLLFRQRSVNTRDPRDLEQAKVDALVAKPNLRAYVSAPVKAQLITGDVWIAQLWNGDAAQAKQRQPNVEYVIPKEGCTIWTDTLVVLASAPNGKAAHQFLNYLLEPDVSAAVSNFTGYGTPNAEGAKKTSLSIPLPTEEERRRLQYLQDLGEARVDWDRLWTEIRNA